MWCFTFQTAPYSGTGCRFFLACVFLEALDILPTPPGTMMIIERIESIPNNTFTIIPTEAAVSRFPFAAIAA